MRGKNVKRKKAEKPLDAIQVDPDTCDLRKPYLSLITPEEIDEIMKRGRPEWKYDSSIAEKIVELTARGLPLSFISKLDGMPTLNVIYRWLKESKEFDEAYAHAREDMADTFFGVAISWIFDTTPENCNARRTQIEGLKWFTSRLNPPKYGDTKRLEATITQQITVDASPLIDRLALLKQAYVPALPGVQDAIEAELVELSSEDDIEGADASDDNVGQERGNEDD